MSQVTPYTQNYSYQSELGTTFGTHLDSEFAELASVTSQISTNLALIQRDDGMIRNQTVTSDSFDSSALALIAGQQNTDDIRWTPRGAWVTATAYVVTDIVETGSPATSYVCAVAHISAAAFATDDASGYWVVLSAPRSLVSADVTTALGFTPVNIAGDTMTGALIAPTATTISGVAFTDSYLSAQDLVRINKGLFSNYSSTKADIVYGFAVNVFRTAGAFLTVGAQIAAIDTNAAASGAWGVACEAWNTASTTSSIIGLETTAVSVRSDNPLGAKVGMYATFKNRADGETQPGAYTLTSPGAPGGSITSTGSGLGSNYYNALSRAVWIDSQQRTATGEFCGWGRGIYFGEYALDAERDTTYPASTAYPIGIDFSAMHYYGGSDPVAAYRMEAAIAFRGFQGIMWSRTPATAATDVNKILTYMDPTTGLWKITNAGVQKFAVDVSTGDVYSGTTIISGATSILALNNTFSGTNTFNAAVSIGANLTFTGNSRRITADFSNATLASRTLFQNSGLNQETSVGVIPNGTSVLSSLALYSSSSPGVAQFAQVACDTSEVTLRSSRTGGAAFVPLTFWTSTSELMRLTTAGAVLINTTTAPVTGGRLRVNGIIQCDNPVAFSAYKNGGAVWAIAPATPTTMPLNAEQIDTNSNYDVGTYAFTPPIGKYLLTACARLAGTSLALGNTILVMIYKNGAQHKSGNVSIASAAAQGPGSTVTCIVESTAGTESYTAVVNYTGGAPVNVIGLETDCYFQGYRIG